MSFSAEQKKILRALHRWFAAGAKPQPVLRVLESRRPVGPAAAYFMEAPRLILVLKGRATFLAVVDQKETRFDVGPGQILFLAQYTWISPVPREPYRSLGMTFRADSTRLIITVRPAMAADGTVTDRRVAHWSTRETLGPKGDQLLQLLRSEPSRRLGERTFGLLVEILLAEVTDLVETAPAHERASRAVLWQMVSDYLAEHWSDPQLSRKSTASYFSRHPNHFSRFFRTHAKKNFRTYLNEIRLERSMQFLRDLRYNVGDVATLCGFTDLPYFIHCFRLRFGFTPGEYRRRHES